LHFYSTPLIYNEYPVVSVSGNAKASIPPFMTELIYCCLQWFETAVLSAFRLLDIRLTLAIFNPSLD